MIKVIILPLAKADAFANRVKGVTPPLQGLGQRPKKEEAKANG